MGTRIPRSILVNILFAIEIKILFLKLITALNSNSNARHIMDQTGTRNSRFPLTNVWILKMNDFTEQNVHT